MLSEPKQPSVSGRQILGARNSRRREHVIIFGVSGHRAHLSVSDEYQLGLRSKKSNGGANIVFAQAILRANPRRAKFFLKLDEDAL